MGTARKGQRGPYKLTAELLREIARLRFEDPLNTRSWAKIAEQVGVSEAAIHQARKGKLWQRIVAEFRERLQREAVPEAIRTLIQVLRYGSSGMEKVQAAKAILQHDAALHAELKHSGEVTHRIVRVPVFMSDGDAGGTAGD